MSLTTALNPTLAASGSSAPEGYETIAPYSYNTSIIVRTAVAAGIIVLVLCALVLSFKISSWIRYNQRLRRQNYLTGALESEQRANAYEIAAWADEPGTAPVHPRRGTDRYGRRSGAGLDGRSSGWGWKERREEKKRKREEGKIQKRGGANAFAVKEWEGTAS